MSFANLAAAFRHQARRLGPRPALRFKALGLWHDWSWDRYFDEVLACAAALVDAGVQPGDRVGLLSENRREWLVTDLAILAAGAVNVPPHAPLTARQVQFQLHDAGVRWLVVSTREQLEKIGKVQAELPQLQGVVAFDLDRPERDVLSWQTFLGRGRQAHSRLAGELASREARLGADDLATIMYTSGTTGNPKGVMLTHGNLLSNAVATDEASTRPPDALLLSWLPFSHIYARTVDHYVGVVAGLTMALSASAETVVADLEEVHPTHVSCVPRFYEKVLTAVASDDKDKMNRRLRKIFGPRIDWLSSGGAPLSLPVAEAYLAAKLELLQGYGLTESSPVISFNRKDRNKMGTVGQPIPGVEVRIAPDGEVLTRGPHVMKGYWNNPQATAEAIRDGWLHTGDLGRLDDEGYLSITGRKKELMVLSNGKKLVPTYIEGLLLADDCIDQAMVCGEGKPFLTALIVPHWENLVKALGHASGRPSAELTYRPDVLVLLQRRIDAALMDVANWERVKKFHVLAEPFTVAGEELTVSLKLRRSAVQKKYQGVIEDMYRHGLV